MKVLVQRVSRAEVRVDARVVGRIGAGLLVFVGVEKGDTAAEAESYARRTAEIRIFPDGEGSQGGMNRSVRDVGGAALVVSQFTLAGSTRRGRRPSFDGAAPPEQARLLYELFVDALRREGIEVATGAFQEMMQVELVNDGPVTFLLDPRAGATGDGAPTLERTG